VFGRLSAADAAAPTPPAPAAALPLAFSAPCLYLINRSDSIGRHNFEIGFEILSNPQFFHFQLDLKSQNFSNILV
jgi:hypothetical protein